MIVLRFALSIFFVLVLLLAGCAKEDTTPPPGPTTAPTVQPTVSPTKTPTTPVGPYGELTMALSTFQDEKFDPITGTLTGVNTLLSPIYDYFTDAQAGSPTTTGIAELWETDADGLSWTFYIRKGIKFHNGEELNAEDVKFTLERYTEKEAFYAYMRNMINSVEIIDNYTLRVHTKGTQPYLAHYSGAAISSQGLVMPKNYFETRGIDYFKKYPVGSGSFRFGRYIPGDILEYEAVDNHWRQTPSFKKLTIVLIPEESTRVATLKTGGADIIDVAEESGQQLEKASFKVSPLGGIINQVSLYGTYDPRAAGMPITDIRVRQALSLAINREEIRDSFFYGKLGPVMPPGQTVNQPELDIHYWRSYSANFYRYDPDEAKKLLIEAGYPDGFTMKFYNFHQAGATHLPKLAEVIAAYWARIGVNAQHSPIDFGAFAPMRRAVQGGPALDLVGQASTNVATEFPISIFQLNSIFSSSGSWNLLTGAFPEIDKLIGIVFSEMDETKRNKALADALKIGMDTYSCIVIGTSSKLGAIGPRVDIDLPPFTLAMPMHAAKMKHTK